MEKLSEVGMIRAQLSMMDIQILQKYVCEIEEPNCYLEIGTRWGGSALFARLANKDIDIYTIDIEPLLEVWKIKPEKFRIFSIKNSSLREAKIWKKPIGVLFIDGSHKKAKEDFDAWEKFVVKNGIVLLHDYALEQRFVVEDCDEIIQEYSDRYKVIFKPKLVEKKEKGFTCIMVLKKL